MDLLLSITQHYGFVCKLKPINSVLFSHFTAGRRIYAMFKEIIEVHHANVCHIIWFIQRQLINISMTDNVTICCLVLPPFQSQPCLYETTQRFLFSKSYCELPIKANIHQTDIINILMPNNFGFFFCETSLAQIL